MEEKLEDFSDMRKSLLTTQGYSFASNCPQSFECIHYPVNKENKFRKGGGKSRTALSRAPYLFPKEPNTFPHMSQFLSVCSFQAAPSFPVSEGTTLSLATTERRRSQHCSPCTTHSCSTTIRCHMDFPEKVETKMGKLNKFCLDCRRNRKSRQGKAGLFGRESQG